MEGMFRGNKPVLILPGILMVLMLVGGYQFLQGSESITNEELQNVVDYQVEIKEMDNGLHINARWDWTKMPVEGLYGEDYIGLYVIDQDLEEARSDIKIEEAVLQLLYSDRVIEESAGVPVQNGVIFAFSNKLVEHESYGNLGQVKVKMIGDELSSEDVRIQLLHTWTDHTSLEKDDATLAVPSFPGAANVPYWIKTFE
jgi:hypothetical protein